MEIWSSRSGFPRLSRRYLVTAAGTSRPERRTSPLLVARSNEGAKSRSPPLVFVTL
jgi:hypothetical protein